MAAPTRIFALNLGTQTITLAEFQTNSSGGITLVRYKKGEILGDPAADPTRVAQSKLQVQQLAEQFGVKGQKANYSIASHVIFTRPVRLPSVGEEAQVEQIVGFEAAQNVPYPIEQVVWDWQLLDAGKGGQMEVILAAIKADLLDEINEAVEAANFKTGVVEIAPMALYNALRYNYADAEGCTLLVDIGSRTTNLLFCEPGKIFPRRLNIGGSTVTTAIAKDLSLPFAEADVRKSDDGFVSLGGSYAEPDDIEVARVSKIIRNQMTRLHQEIARSITFYRSEHAGSAPSRVLLAGGTASLPYMREFFQEKFPGLEVDYFNPLRNVSVASSVDLEEAGRDAHTLGEIIGLGLRGAVRCPMELNLRPAGVIRAEKMEAQKPYMIAAGALLLVTILAWWLYFSHSAEETRAKVAEVNQKVAPLQALDSRIKSERSSINRLHDFAEPLLKTVREREYWSRVLEDLNKRLPSDYIWVTSFEPPTKAELEKAANEAGKNTTGKKTKKGAEPEIPIVVMLRGLYLGSDAGNSEDVGIVDKFTDNLKQSELYEPIFDANAGYRRDTQDNERWARKWEVPLKMKNPIDLK